MDFFPDMKTIGKMANIARYNKISGFYSSTDNIENFKFKVKLKEINKSIPMLNNDDTESNLGKDDESGGFEEREFSWQEKVSNKGKESGSLSDTENVVKSKRKLVSYVHEDGYDYDESLIDSEKNEEYLSERLYESLSLKGDLKNMIIVADMSDYEKDPSEVSPKREHILFVISWNASSGRLTVSPDFNGIIENPYLIELSYGSKQIFHYSIEPVLRPIDKEKLFEISAVTKISQQETILRLRKKHQKFTYPPKKVSRTTIVFEILSGSNFQCDEIFIEYTVHLPYGYKSDDPLRGRTQVSTVRSGTGRAHFGHVFELSIDYDLQIGNNAGIPMTIPRIYFEIVSCDTYRRFRTEGYCYTEVPMFRPGRTKFTLNSSRPAGSDTKRFFIGERLALKDVTWIGAPSTLEGNCIIKHGISTITSGRIDAVATVVIQNASSKTDPREDEREKLHADILFRSVGNVLRAYREAKEELNANL